MDNYEPTISDEDATAFADWLEKNCYGEERAMQASALCSALARGVLTNASLKTDGARTLRALAHAAVALGRVVCTGSSGYWYALSAEEVERSRARLISQAHAMLDRSRALARASEQAFGARQFPLF